MDTSQLQFNVVKYWMDDELMDQICHLNHDLFYSKVTQPALEDARVLYRMVVREINAHNAGIRMKRTLLKKMKFKPNYFKSNLFNGINIPINKIDSLIAKYPDKDAFEIYKLLRGR